jgi:hypothetical protein
MPTTASLTLSTADFTGGGSFSVSTTLLKAGLSTDLDQFTGIAKVKKATAEDDIAVFNASEFSNTGAKLYFKNTSTSGYILMEVGGDVAIGRLYPGDWMFIPVGGTENIKASTSEANQEYEFGIFHEG